MTILIRGTQNKLFDKSDILPNLIILNPVQFNGWVFAKLRKPCYARTSSPIRGTRERIATQMHDMVVEGHGHMGTSGHHVHDMVAIASAHDFCPRPALSVNVKSSHRRPVPVPIPNPSRCPTPGQHRFLTREAIPRGRKRRGTRRTSH